MKYVIALLSGMLVGGALFLLLLYHNPFAGNPSLSPLLVSGQKLIELSYSPAPAEAIALTNNGEVSVPPVPHGVDELWEPSVSKTRVLVTQMIDVRGAPAGIGIKFSSDSEQTRLLNADAIVDSAWHIWLPERGSLFVNQTENLWTYLRTVVVPARLSSSDDWRGTWFGITTSGPGALGTGRVTGGSGEFAGFTSEAVESLSARAWSVDGGPVAVTGSLTISLLQAPDPAD
ncbi:MAG TPA: hypothetical protein VMO24_09920 [Woeseiaceae bacterium]|nr:hypothetical protein [Woeseiaceae bacterium]